MKPLDSSIRDRLNVSLTNEMNGNRAKLARAIGFPESTFRKIWNGGNISRPSLQKIQDFLKRYPSGVVQGVSLPSKEHLERSQLLKLVSKRVEKLKYILLLLEEELGEFRDDSPEIREILRKLLDIDDIGYVASLLTMICDEKQFQRWRVLSSNGFNSFKGGK
ncbi:MAG: hypothetical protein P9X22_00365 [Candidatus Zapsychrus exili]|nr:hypothetical protein [Candidatus Zapsychrus exili]